MNSGKESKPTLRMLDLDALVQIARIQGLYSTTVHRGERILQEMHITLMDSPTKHQPHSECWCEPELVHEGEESKIYRHRRVQ